MKETWTIKNLDQARIIAHPLRMRLLEAFCHEPLTTKQVAKLLGMQPTKLYHHVDALERVGLVRLVKRKKKRGTTEKYYQTIACRFIVDRKLFTVAPDAGEAVNNLQSMATALFEETSAELNQSIADKLIKPGNKHGPALLARSYISATPEQINGLKKKIETLLKEFRASKSQAGDLHYGLTIAFYPVKRPKAGGKGLTPAGYAGKEKK